MSVSYQYRYWPCIYLTWDRCQTSQYHTPQPNRGIEETQLKKYKRQDPSNPMTCLFGRGLWYVNRLFFSRRTCFKFDGHLNMSCVQNSFVLISMSLLNFFFVFFVFYQGNHWITPLFREGKEQIIHTLLLYCSSYSRYSGALLEYFFFRLLFILTPYICTQMSVCSITLEKHWLLLCLSL